MLGWTGRAHEPTFEELRMTVFQPQNDRVLIQRIEEPSGILLTDRSKSIKGLVLAVGPGKWIPGEWWKMRYPWTEITEVEGWTERWEWIDGHRQELTVKPGMKVLFNSKWNDFSAGENKGTGSDFSGPLERPLPLKADPMLHLVTEGDIFAVVPDFNFTASMKETRPPFMQNVEIKGPWNG